MHRHVIEGLMYIFGAILTAFTLVVLLRSNVGMPPWDILHVALAETTPLTFGMAIEVVSLLITLSIVIHRRSLKYLFMIIPFVLVGRFIDIFNLYVLSDFNPTGVVRVMSFSFSLLLLPLGSAMLVVTRYPAGIYDELMLAIMNIFKTNELIKVRFLMELTPVFIGVVISRVLLGTLGSLHIGTLLAVILAGPLLQFYIKMIRRLYHGHQQTH